jgi:hypothetical protein
VLQEGIKVLESKPLLHNLNDMIQLISPRIPRYCPGQTPYERFAEQFIFDLVGIHIVIWLMCSLYLLVITAGEKLSSK